MVTMKDRKTSKRVTQERTPLEARLKPGLAGRCFFTRDERGRVQFQGVVHCVVPSQQGDLVLVQYFEAMFGQLNTMALVPLADMATSKGTSLGDYVFFEDDEHLRDYLENVQSYREDRINREDERAAEQPCKESAV